MTAAPTSPAGMMPTRPLADQPAGDLRGDERDEPDRPGRGGGGGGEAGAAEGEAQLGPAQADAEARPRCRRPARAPGGGGCTTMATGTRIDEREGERPHVLPAPPVEAAGEPDGRPLGVVEVGPGEQVRDAGVEQGGDADADEHQAVAGDALLDGEQVDGDDGERPSR